MLGRQAGSTVSVYMRKYNAESPKHDIAKGLILKEDKILCRSGYMIYLCLVPLVSGKTVQLTCDLFPTCMDTLDKRVHVMGLVSRVVR